MSFEVDPASAARLDRAIENIALLTGREIGDVVQKAAIRASKSAAGSTKPSRKNRRFRAVSKADHGRAVGERFHGKTSNNPSFVPWWAKYRVWVWRNNVQGVVFVRTQSALSKIKEIKRRGLAKRVWAYTGAPFGVRAANSRSDEQKYASTTKRHDGRYLNGVTLTNKIPYITKHAPQSALVGVQSAERQITNYDIPRAERAIARRWGMGALV